MINMLSLQEEVASEIATRLAGKLLPSKRRSGKEINPLAYDAFLKGRYWSNRLTAQGFNRGILYFQQALDLQPDYAEAYAGLAACHCRLGGHGIEIVRPDVSLPKAINLATRALELDDTLAEPNAVLGMIYFKYKWDLDKAELYLQRALENNSSLFEAHLWYSQIYEGTGRHDHAVKWARLAHSLNPLSQAATLNLGWQLYQSGQVEKAEEQFDKLIESDPDFWGGHWGKGHCYKIRGMHHEAIMEFTRAVELDGGHTLPISALGYTYALAGQRNEALAVIDRLVTLSRDTYVSPMHIAIVYAGLQEPDAAFEWLDKAYSVRARSLAWLTVTRELDGLRDDPRYDALVSAIGIAGE
jgi:tetratricopeptide (TPR) repeat protein